MIFIYIYIEVPTCRYQIIFILRKDKFEKYTIISVIYTLNDTKYKLLNILN